MNSPNVIFVDSDAFIALAREDDSNHAKSLKILELLQKDRYHFVTSNYVFSEVITVLSLRLSREAAMKFIENMKSPDSAYTIQWIHEQSEKEALEIFAKQRSKNVSFVDCTNMAIMSINKIEIVFSFDEVYKKNGYTLIGNMVKSMVSL